MPYAIIPASQLEPGDRIVLKKSVRGYRIKSVKRDVWITLFFHRQKPVCLDRDEKTKIYRSKV